MSRDLVIEAKREICTVKSGLLDTQSKTIELYTFHLPYSEIDKILSSKDFNYQLEIYLTHWDEDKFTGGNWIIYDKFSQSDPWWEDEYVVTDVVFPESSDYKTIVEESELEPTNGDPIAYIKEKPYKSTLLREIKELRDQDYELLIVGV